MQKAAALFLVIILCLTACGRDQKVTRGAVLFDQNCAICHGADARGGGGANVAGLSKTPPDLTVLSLENNGSFPIQAVLMTLDGYTRGTHAGRRMMPFEALSSEKRRRVATDRGSVRVPAPHADLVAYLQSIQR